MTRNITSNSEHLIFKDLLKQMKKLENDISLQIAKNKSFTKAVK